MQDRLSALLDRYPLQARVFHSGSLCGTARFDGNDGVGHLHVLRRGRLRMDDGAGDARVHAAPCLLYFPRPTAHWIEANEDDAAEIVCASIGFGSDIGNPLTRHLPGVLVLPLDTTPGLAATLDLLFDEAFHDRCGRQAALDRLSELLVLQLLRHAMDAALVRGGVVAGLGDPRLAKALNAIHAHPGDDWTLASLARVSGMSRARFAARFHDIVGVTPGDYLGDWRMGIVKALLRRGRPIKQIALEVGYGNASALARAFAALHDGLSPKRWLAQQQGE